MNFADAESGNVKTLKATLKWFNGVRGFGFVVPEGTTDDAFLHVSVLQNANIRKIGDGAEITCTIEFGPKGAMVREITEVHSLGDLNASGGGNVDHGNGRDNHGRSDHGHHHHDGGYAKRGGHHSHGRDRDRDNNDRGQRPFRKNGGDFGDRRHGGGDGYQKRDGGGFGQRQQRAGGYDKPRYQDGGHGGNNHSQDPGEPMTGAVKWYKDDKGFGFIEAQDGGSDIFIHRSCLERAGLHTLQPGQKLNLMVRKSQRGREAASITQS